MNDQSFEETTARICDKDSRYDMEAYYFMRDALGYATKKYERTGPNRHVSGVELSEAIREHAIREFGPITFLVLTDWGLYKTSDFGEIVYNLINEGVFGKSESDRKEDFNNVFEFDKAFLDPYEPRIDNAKVKASKAPSKAKSARKPAQ